MGAVALGAGALVGGDEAAVVDGLEDVALDFFPAGVDGGVGLAGDAPIGVALGLGVDVAVEEHEGFVGEADDAFDEVDGGVFGVFEDGDVEAVGFGEAVEVFLNEDAVAGVATGAVVDGDGVEAHRAAEVGVAAAVGGAAVGLEGVVALVALGADVLAQEGGGHGPGGDDEGLDDVGAEDEG